MTAAPVLSIICTVAIFALCLLYCTWAKNRAVARGEVWALTPTTWIPALFEIRTTAPASRLEGIPAHCGAAAGDHRGRPLRVQLHHAGHLRHAAGVVPPMCSISPSSREGLARPAGYGLGGGISGIGGLAAVLAFGTVVQNSGAFQDIVDWVLNLDMNPYVRGVFATSVFSGITGSSSGGLRLMYQSLADTFISSGCNLEILHRLTSIAAGGLDTLPPLPRPVPDVQRPGVNHKNAYRHVFACSVAIPVIVVVVATAICVFAGI